MGSEIVIAVLVTSVLSMAVKQLSYALMQGSLFQPLHRSVRQRMRRGVPGFQTLSELLSCKLCTSMQMSIWFVMIPAIVLGHHFGLSHMVLGADASPTLAVAFLILGSFLYAMGISGIALGLWIYLEYPAARYEEVELKLRAAEETIEELEAELRMSSKR